MNSHLADTAAIVLEFHRPESSLCCIKSLVDAGLTRILLWDNSTDSGVTQETLLVLLQRENLLQYVTFAGTGINLGFSAGINAAMAFLSSTQNIRYALLMNNDATINKEGVSALLESLQSAPENVLAAPQYLSNQKRNPAQLFYQTYFAALTEKKYLGSLAFLSGCCLLVDMEKAGSPLLDEAFFMYGEDIELSFRLKRKGYRLCVANQANVQHVGAASSVVGSPFYEYHVARGHILLTSRIAHSPLHALILWPSRMISLAARSILRALRSGSAIPIRALWRAVFNLGVAG
ncbi:MAG: glycosyltransferase family 2 protein [Arenimonas sp.]